MKKLNKLAKGKDAKEKRAIAHAELEKVKPHKFTQATDIKGRSVHDVTVEILSSEPQGELLKVMAKCWLDGVEMPVDNPLYYKNAPMMVPDGTFETVVDSITGGSRQVANFHEDAPEALRQIVLETLKVTALKAV
jgi:hypothetical protein